MRIIIIGSSWFTAPLRRLGHEVVCVSQNSHGDVQVQHPFTYAWLIENLKSNNFEPQALIVADDGNLPLLMDPENCLTPAVFQSIDTYCNPWHVPYAAGFDHVLVGQKDFVSLFIPNHACDATWMPLFASYELGQWNHKDRDIPVAFVGTLGHKNNPLREPFLRDFQKNCPLILRQGDFRPIFARSLIVLNQTAFSEINFRCFEAMACGAALLMETCNNGLNELFSPGENILPTYIKNDANSAAEIASKAIENPKLTREIAEAGRELVLSKHTSDVRAKDLDILLSNLVKSKAQEARLADRERRRFIIRSGYIGIAVELDSPALAKHKEFYLKWGKNAESIKQEQNDNC